MNPLLVVILAVKIFARSNLISSSTQKIAIYQPIKLSEDCFGLLSVELLSPPPLPLLLLLPLPALFELLGVSVAAL